MNLANSNLGYWDVPASAAGAVLAALLAAWRAVEPFETLRAAALRMRARLAASRRKRQEARELAALDDRMLRDLGLSTADLGRLLGR